MLNKVFIIFIIFMVEFNSTSAKINLMYEKFFELDLTDQEISPEGGVIELFKNRSFCLLRVKLYDNYGKKINKFKFFDGKLIRSNYEAYRYKVGLLNLDSDLKSLISDNDLNKKDEIDLIYNKVFVGDNNKLIENDFNMYISKIPNDILNKNCRK